MPLKEYTSIVSTKKLTAPQQELILNAGMGLVHYDILETEQVEHKLQLSGDAVIITSKNALIALENVPVTTPVFCVGTVTSGLVKNHTVKFTAQNAQDLATHIIEQHQHQSFDYLCSEQRRDELPDLLRAQKIELKEHIVYRSVAIVKSFDRIFAAVLFYSPRGVSAFAPACRTGRKANSLQSPCAICIGETTATEAKKWFKHVRIASKSTVENTIVTAIKLLRND
jgi:uroporphyrinogen-III synthase